jgi:hypothetical protein
LIIALNLVKHPVVCGPERSDDEETDYKRLELARQTLKQVLNRLWSEVLGQPSEGECENEQRHSDGEDTITEGIQAPEPRVAISIHIGPHIFLIRGLRKSITDMAHAGKTVALVVGRSKRPELVCHDNARVNKKAKDEACSPDR